jgi:hypothetical protein
VQAFLLWKSSKHCILRECVCILASDIRQENRISFEPHYVVCGLYGCIPRLKCDGTRAETRFRLSRETDESFQIGRGASVQSTTGSRGVRISGSIAGYTMYRGRVKSTGYPLHSPVSPSLPLPCVTVCHHISTGLLYDMVVMAVMLNTPCTEVVWRVLATHSIRQFPLYFPSHASPCAITFLLDSTTVFYVLTNVTIFCGKKLLNIKCMFWCSV